MAINKLFFVLLASGLLGYGQLNPSPSSILKPLTWQARRQALHSMLEQSELSDSQVQDAIARLLTLEDNTAAKSPQIAESVDDQLYLEELYHLCERIVDQFNSQLALMAVYEGNYDPQSEVAAWLIHRPDIFPLVMKRIRSKDILIEGEAVQTLGILILSCRKHPEIQTCSLMKNQSGLPG